MQKFLFINCCVLFLIPLKVFCHFDQVEFLEIHENSYNNPTEIDINKNYRITLHNHQLVYFRFRKALLEPNETYIAYTSFPGSHSSSFEMKWVDFSEDYAGGYFNTQNSKFRPTDSYKMIFLTDHNSYVIDKKADIYINEDGIAFYHFFLFMWQFVYSRDPDSANKSFDFVIGIKKPFNSTADKHELWLYIIASIIVLVWFLLFINRKLSLFNDLTKVTYCPSDVPKTE